MANVLGRAASVLVIVLFLAGCAAAPAPPVASSPDFSSPTPSSTVVPEPRVALNGDCDAVLAPSRVEALFASATLVPSRPTQLGSVPPDMAASAATIGALTCGWSVEGSPFSYVTIDVAPEDAVPPAVLESSAAFVCEGWGLCGRAESHDGVWARAAVSRWSAPELQMPAEEEAALNEAVRLLLAGVFANPSDDLSGVPVEPDPTWWKLGACDLLEPAVVEATGIVDPEPGFPSDVLPGGPMWDVLVGNGAAQWCGWYSYAGDAPSIVELDLQPGIGEPSSEQLEHARAERIEIAGADVAYLLQLDERPSARSTKLLAVAGGNRLTVGGDDVEAVATRVLAALLPAD